MAASLARYSMSVASSFRSGGGLPFVCGGNDLAQLPTSANFETERE